MATRVPTQAGGDAARESERTRVLAARALGLRLDRLVGAVARVPSFVFGLLACLGVIATFPSFHPSSVSVLGLRLSNWFAVWVLNIGFVMVVAAVAAAGFFLVRALVAFLEEGRWPRKAGPV